MPHALTVGHKQLARIALRERMTGYPFIRKRIIKFSYINTFYVVNSHLICILRSAKGSLRPISGTETDTKLQKKAEKIWWNKKKGLTLHSQSGD
jgi:hypothetical protein